MADLPTFNIAKMNCLANFITFRTLTCAGEVVPSTSGKNFEDLEGISIGKISDITTEKYKNAIQLVNERTAHAISCMMDELLAQLPDHKFKQAVKTHRYGRFLRDYLPAANALRGIRLHKYYSPLSYFLLERVTVKSNTTKPDHEILVFEGSETAQINLKVYKVDLIAGQEVTVEIDHRVYSNKVFIVSNNVDVLMSDSYVQGNRGCEEVHCNYGRDYLSVSGWDGSQTSYKSFGLRVEYSVRCDKELLFCRLAHENANAILYRAGVEILKEWLAGNRLTFVSIHSSEWAEKTIVEWTETSRYLLAANMDGMSEYLSDLDSVCLPCEGSRIVKVMP